GNTASNKDQRTACGWRRRGRGSGITWRRGWRWIARNRSWRRCRSLRRTVSTNAAASDRGQQGQSKNNKQKFFLIHGSCIHFCLGNKVKGRLLITKPAALLDKESGKQLQVGFSK